MTSTSNNLVLFIVWLALVCDGYDLYVYGATVPGFLGNPMWGADPGLVASVGSIALVGMLIGSLGAGTLTDRLGRRKVLMISLGIFSLGMLLCGLAPSFTWFGAFRFLTCIGVGGLLPTAVAMGNEFAKPGRSSIGVGAILTGPPIGSLIAALSATALVPAAGVRPVYFLGLASVLVLAFVWAKMPESPAYLNAVGRHAEAVAISEQYGLESSKGSVPKGQHDSSVRGLFSQGNTIATILMWAACFISLMTIFGITTWLPAIMKAAGFATQSSIAFLAVYSVGAIIGTVLGSRIAQRTSPKLMVIAGFAAAAIALFAVSLSHSHAILITAALIAGFGGLGTQNLLNDHIAQYYHTNARATGLGWALSAGRIGAIVGPTFGGYFAALGGNNPSVATAAFATTSLLGLAVAAVLPRRNAIQHHTAPSAEQAEESGAPA